ncbi:hypothetical protein WEI85_46090 [Actinomycetes bacterium KLBMP 9797]
MRTRLGLAVVIPVLVLAVAACGAEKGSDIPTAGGGSGGATPAATASLSSDQRALKFAQCMREHGIDMPDPGPDGGGFLGEGDAANTDKVKAATTACRQYMPDGGELRQPSAEEIAQLRKFAQCMREHGVANFPDPEADGFMDTRKAGIDPEDAAYQAAEEACKDLRPGQGS